MHPRVLALMASQHGLITFRQAIGSGVSADQVARHASRGEWVRVRHGVYADGEVWRSLDEYVGRPLLGVRAAHLVLESPHVFSHDSAALLHGMGLFGVASGLVHVTRPDVRGDRTKAAIKHHGAIFELEQVTTAGGLPCLDLARTSVDIAREHGLTAGVAACDHALRVGVPRGDLLLAYEAMWSWPYVTTVREVVELADGGSDNAAESAARVLVHELGIGRPETQFGLTDVGRTVWCDLRVGRHIFEFDGRAKYGVDPDAARSAVWAEKKRQDFICGFKLGMSRITYVDLHADRATARDRLAREYADTEARFGSAIEDLAPYIVRRRH